MQTTLILKASVIQPALLLTCDRKTLCFTFICLGMPSDFVIVKTPSGLMLEYFNLRLETFWIIFEYVVFFFERNSFFTRIGSRTFDAASEEEAAVDLLDEP